MRWSVVALTTFLIAYFGTGLMNVCEVRVVPAKLLFAPAVAIIAAVSAFAVTNVQQALRVLGVVGVSAIAGQTVGYGWPWICF